MKNNTEAINININYCYFCKQEGIMSKAEYDGKTKLGPWAGMCKRHFKVYGIGLGLGRGQRLMGRK